MGSRDLRTVDPRPVIWRTIDHDVGHVSSDDSFIIPASATLALSPWASEHRDFVLVIERKWRSKCERTILTVSSSVLPSVSSSMKLLSVRGPLVGGSPAKPTTVPPMLYVTAGQLTVTFIDIRSGGSAGGRWCHDASLHWVCWLREDCYRVRRPRWNQLGKCICLISCCCGDRELFKRGAVLQNQP